VFWRVQIEVISMKNYEEADMSLKLRNYLIEPIVLVLNEIEDIEAWLCGRCRSKSNSSNVARKNILRETEKLHWQKDGGKVKAKRPRD
jgi:hypothetical protein